MYSYVGYGSWVCNAGYGGLGEGMLGKGIGYVLLGEGIRVCTAV